MNLIEEIITNIWEKMLILMIAVFLLGCTPEQKDCIQKSVDTMTIIGNDAIMELKNKSCDLYVLTSDFFKEHDFNFNLNESSINLAVTLSSKISTFEKIDASTFENYEIFKKFQDNINYVIGSINENIGTQFRTMDVTPEEFDKVADKVQKYTPLIEPYNNLIEKSRLVNKSDQTSLGKFYISAFALGTDVFLVQGSYIHKAIFPKIGELNGVLGIYKLKDFCGNKCFGLAMYNVYWWFRVRVEKYTMSFGEWAGDHYDSFKLYVKESITKIDTSCRKPNE